MVTELQKPDTANDDLKPDTQKLIPVTQNVEIFSGFAHNKTPEMPFLTAELYF
jgi:hypothetical protein